MFYNMFFQISDCPGIYRQCTAKDEKLLAIFEVDTGPYSREQFGYKKRGGSVKLKVKNPLVEARLQLLVKITIRIPSISNI